MRFHALLIQYSLQENRLKSGQYTAELNNPIMMYKKLLTPVIYPI